MTLHRAFVTLVTAVSVALVALILIPASCPVLSQDTSVPPAAAAEYMIRLRPVSGSPDGFRAAYEHLLPTLQRLQAEGDLVDFEYLPAIRSVRVLSLGDRVQSLISRPEVGELEIPRPRSSHQTPLGGPLASAAPSQPGSASPLAGGAISGVVRDHNGTPIANASVSTEWDDPEWVFDLTDASGAYQLAASVDGTYRVSARKSGYVDSNVQTVTVPPDATGIDLTFPQAYTVSGVIRDYLGAPVENATVSTDWDDPYYSWGNSNASGEYALLVPAGTYHVSAYRSGYADSNVQTVTVPPDATGIDLTFPVTYNISGVVVDQDGNPVAGASVYGGVQSVTSAANGSFTIAQAAGDIRVSAYKTGYSSPYGVYVPLPPAVSGVELLLLEKDGTLQGQIVDDQGTPVANATVSASGALCGSGSESAQTAADGSYSLSVPAGIYRVSARADGYIPTGPEEVVVSSGLPHTEWDLVLNRALYTIRGTVRDGAGQPLAGGWVGAQACGTYYSVQTDAAGAYTLQVGPGTYSVSADHQEYVRSPVEMVSVPPSADGVDFALAAPYTISGRVTDPQGHPIEDVDVETSWSLDPYDDWDRTDADGNYSLRVPAGTYHVSAEELGYTQPAVQVVAVPPDKTNVNFVMSPTGLTIAGTVSDTAGHPLPQAYVLSFLPDQTSSTGTQVYYNGTYVRGMLAGVHRVYARASCYEPSADQSVTLPPSQSGINFSLAAADQLISGVVRDDSGNPVCDAWVRTDSIAGTSWQSDWSEGNGRYALGVAPGTHTVRASKAGYGSAPDQMVTVPPHARQTDFVLPAPDNTIQGSVRDNKGIAVPGATVEARGSSGTVSVATAADGRYTIAVSDGTWTVSAQKTGYVTMTTPRTATVPPNQTGVDFVMIPEGDVHRVYLPLIMKQP